MKDKVNVWAVLLVIIALLSVLLVWKTNQNQLSEKKQIDRQTQVTQKAKKTYDQTKNQSVEELPKYEKVHKTFSKFMSTSVEAINQGENKQGQPFLNYGTPDAFEATSLLFTGGEGGQPHVKILDENMSFDSDGATTNALGTITFQNTINGKKAVKKLDVHAELTADGYVNTIQFGTFMDKKGGQ